MSKGGVEVIVRASGGRGGDRGGIGDSVGDGTGMEESEAGQKLLQLDFFMSLGELMQM